MARRSTHPVPWLLFSAGGVVSALFLPVLVFLFGLVFALGVASPPTYEELSDLLGNPLTRLVLFFVCMLSLFHFAHRFRYTLNDGLLIKRRKKLVATLCYGAAVVGTVLAAGLLWQLQ